MSTLYVIDGHSSSTVSDPMIIKSLYEAAQRA
jgi:hypothetical protein